MCAKLRTVAASNNRDDPTRSLYYCLFAPHTYIFVLRAHPVRGESYNQRNTTGEVATVCLSSVIRIFYQQRLINYVAVSVKQKNQQAAVAINKAPSKLLLGQEIAIAPI